MQNDSLRCRAVVLLPVLLLFFLYGCSEPANQPSANTGLKQLPALLQQHVQQYLLAQSTNSSSLILCKNADLNADGYDDIIVLYTPAHNNSPLPNHQGNVMCVLLVTPAGYIATNALPAPIERQHIQVRDIDNAPPLEFVIMGSKGAQTGVGVYRIVNDQIENLFGESMEDCC